MTAEVAVINKSAVAIAADSALTITSNYGDNRHPEKIFNTANKVFALSKYAPVGIMFYNAMELGSVPWETLVKVYRQHLGQAKFDHLDDYADDFFKFLCNNETLFNEEQIKDVLSVALRKFFLTLSNDIDSQNKAKEEFDKQINILESADYADSFDESDTRLSREYKSLVDKAANFVFESSIIENLKTEYRKLAALAITKKNSF